MMWFDLMRRYCSWRIPVDYLMKTGHSGVQRWNESVTPKLNWTGAYYMFLVWHCAEWFPASRLITKVHATGRHACTYVTELTNCPLFSLACLLKCHFPKYTPNGWHGGTRPHSNRTVLSVIHFMRPTVRLRWWAHRYLICQHAGGFTDMRHAIPSTRVTRCQWGQLPPPPSHDSSRPVCTVSGYA